MAASNLRRLAIWLSGCAAISTAGCEKPAGDDMSWAQSALARNPQLKVLSVDRQAHAFTVRLKDSGELRIVQADALVAVLPDPAGEHGGAGRRSPAARLKRLPQRPLPRPHLSRARARARRGGGASRRSGRHRIRARLQHQLGAREWR